MSSTEQPTATKPLHHARRYTYHKTTRTGERRKNRFMRLLFERLLPPLEENELVVEIGAGRGEFAREAVQRGLQYEGIEPCLELRRKLEAEGFEVHDHVVPPLPCADASVDLIHSMDVVEHLRDYHEVMELCLDASRSLRPGGHFSIICPNYDTLGRVFFAYEYQHGFITNRGRLEGVLRDSGFVCERSLTFLTELGLTRWRFFDRLLAYTLLPIFTSGPVCGTFRALGMQLLLFRIHKTLCDHVAVVARKPA